MKREQSRAGSRFAECEKSRLKAKILITLALLLTAVTGAWAQATAPSIMPGFMVPTDNSTSYNGNTWTWVQVAGVVTNFQMDYEIKENSQFATSDGTFKPTRTQLITALKTVDFQILGQAGFVTTVQLLSADGTVQNTAEINKALDWGDDTRIKLNSAFFASIDTEHDYIIRVNLNDCYVSIDANKTASFEMPAFDMELTPVYAPVAAFAVVSEVEQKPTAIKGIIAGEAKDIVKAGTVAKIGKTENPQGTLMYLVTTTKEQPTSTEGFNATVPTGAVLTGSYAEDQTVYVWYYIKGIDAAEGVTPTAENTFNDSEICTTPIEVTVLSNKFDIQFKAANANTIEAGKATVKVGDAAAEVKDSKLEGVKMDSKVTITAKEGYKFRKVEVKKTEVLTITVAKGSTDLSGDKLLYYTPGETYRQAIANHPENKLDGGLGWNIWEGGNDATIFYKESANNSRDLSIDGDQHFRPTDSINLDTVIDPTLNFYFVAQF